MVESGNTPQAFGTPGGKHYLAKKIVPLIPEHETYVEPYAGGAAVYFYKEPVEKEVLNDKDKEIAFAYRFIRDMTPAQYEWLKKKKWTVDREHFERIKNSKPSNEVERFYKFYYTKKASYGRMGTTVDPLYIKRGHIIDINRLRKAQQRLKGTATNSGDALRMIDKHDSKNTFFYIDPPYPGRANCYNTKDFTDEDLRDLTDKLRHIKGKFIISINKENASQLPQQFHVKRIAVERSLGSSSKGKEIKEKEILASNYDTELARRNKILERHANNFLQKGHV